MSMPVIDATELAINRENTRAYIAAKAETLALKRIEKNKTDRAGVIKRVAGTVVETVRLIEPGGSGFQAPYMTEVGESSPMEFLLLANWDSAIQADMEFSHEGGEYRLSSLLPENGYERRAVVVRV